VLKFDFKSQFSTSKIIPIFFIFFWLKNTILGVHFLLIIDIFIASIFEALYFLKWCPIFDSSPLLQFSKFNNFIWPKLIFLAKNLSNFVSLPWKLHKRYCHSAHSISLPLRSYENFMLRIFPFFAVFPSYCTFFYDIYDLLDFHLENDHWMEKPSIFIVFSGHLNLNSHPWADGKFLVFYEFFIGHKVSQLSVIGAKMCRKVANY